MTIIDTTLYCNGALRLSRHGAGHGGNVLMHVPTGRQVDVPATELRSVERFIEAHVGVSTEYIFTCVVGHCERKRA